jgi:hypothetical protein
VARDGEEEGSRSRAAAQTVARKVPGADVAAWEVPLVEVAAARHQEGALEAQAERISRALEVQAEEILGANCSSATCAW